MNDYSGFNQTIATSIDPHLSSSAINHAYEIIKNFPLSVKEQIQVIGRPHSDIRIDEIRKLTANQNTKEAILPAYRYRSILETPAGSRQLRKYLWHVRDKEIVSKNVSAGLAFEPRINTAKQVNVT